MTAPRQESRIFVALIEDGIALSAERLAKLSGTHWEATSSSIEMLPIVRTLKLLRDDKTPHCGAYMRSQSLLPLEFLILYPKTTFVQLREAFLKHAGPRQKALLDKEQPLICEISNIIGQGVVQAMADRLKLSIVLTVPEFMEGSKADLLGATLDAFDGNKDAVILSHVEMFSEKLLAACTMVVIFDARIASSLLKKNAPNA